MIGFLLDQNLSPQTTAFLRNLGLNASDVRELGKEGISDDELYAIASVDRWILITYDLDFSRRFLADKALPGLILLRVHPQTIERIHTALQDFLERIEPDELVGQIVTVENHRYRLRRVRARSIHCSQARAFAG